MTVQEIQTPEPIAQQPTANDPMSTDPLRLRGGKLDYLVTADRETDHSFVKRRGTRLRPLFCFLPMWYVSLSINSRAYVNEGKQVRTIVEWDPLPVSFSFHRSLQK